ncbi:hypothetical protein AA12717_1704 [Gluconacetobacter sacchari DSM 12717]|uniref:Uncharacterized protein n=1 Tax=Gluconacetobacter sacchari DSM 12717 TaxID=1307940 RepID=A0ABQ0P6E7_9PROT|nr:hypothetical protein AA12717_1704 [Gluconacetobacter sacchari DSM 12717]
MRVADADHTNQTLRGFVSDAVSPPSADPVSVQGWLEDELASAAATNTSIIVDFGAGDQVIANLAREVTLVEAIKEIGLQPTAVYFIGADPDDVATVEMLLHSFAPTATIIAYARHVVARHVDPSVALRSLIERSNMLSALLDGDARLVPVPVLSCAHKLSERRVGFLDAMSGHGPEPLGPFDRQRVTTWWRAMETAFTPVLHWLP